jgi:hypothetical protein
MKPRDRITIARAPTKWANDLVTRHHYLHRPVHPRACPFAYRIIVDNQTAGTIIMATIHFTRQRKLFGYPGLPTRWQVLVISRVWIDPQFQNRTITDSKGRPHTLPVATCAIAQMLKRVQRDWIDHHPPRFPNQPYHVRLVMAYADTGVGHEGVIYQAANFTLWGSTNNNRPRHGSRGEQSGTIKKLYIYRLPKPEWIAPAQARLI